MEHFFPKFSEWIGQMKDPRDPDSTHYRLRHLLWCGLGMFSLHCGSRNQFRWDRLGSTFVHNFCRLAGTDEDTVAHPDTLSKVLEKMPLDQSQKLLSRMAQNLIRMKALDDARVLGHFLVAVDGTGYLEFDHPHCPHCLKVEHAGGSVSYRHPALLACLIGPKGMVVPLAVEFQQNPEGIYEKQDCETKAFIRLAQRLKQDFPQTPFCLLLDALYASQTVMHICVNNSWKFCISFKPDDMKALWPEAVSIQQSCPQNRSTSTHLIPNQKTEELTRCRQTITWANHLDYHLLTLSALFMEEEITTPDQLIQTRQFAWLTPWELREDNARIIAGGSRQRWTIENQAINVLKNGGFDLEHVYSHDFLAAQHYFHLMLIALLFQQLMTLGSLIKNFRKEIGTCKNYAILLRQMLKTLLVSWDTAPPGQIRFSTA